MRIGGLGRVQTFGTAGRKVFRSVDGGRNKTNARPWKAERSAAASALDQVRCRHGANLDQTSARVASEAASILRDPNATRAAREAAASALVQTRLHG